MDRSHGRRPSSGGAGTARRLALAVVGAAVGLLTLGATPAAAADDAVPPAAAASVVEAICPTDDEPVEVAPDGPLVGTDAPDLDLAADPGAMPPIVISSVPSWSFHPTEPDAPVAGEVELDVEIGEALTLAPCVDAAPDGPVPARPAPHPLPPPVDAPADQPVLPDLPVTPAETAPGWQSAVPAPAPTPAPAAVEEPVPVLAVLSSLACGPDELAVDLDADAVDDTCYDPTSVPWFDGHYSGREAPAATAGADALLEIVHAAPSAPATQPPPAVVPSATSAPVELAHTGAGVVPLVPLGLAMLLLGTAARLAAGRWQARSVENLWAT